MSGKVNEARTFARNAKGVREVLNMKFDTLPFEGDWFEAFNTPERRGVWFIWGNTGNGKTSFVMQLCKYLCRFGRVAYDSLEEGACLTMQNTLMRFQMQEVNRRFLLLDAEPLDQLSLRIKRQKAPDFVVIDSFQYTQMTYRQYIEFKEKHRGKLLILSAMPPGVCQPDVAQKRDVRRVTENLCRRIQGIFQRPFHRAARAFRYLAGKVQTLLGRRNLTSDKCLVISD